jgi:multidrug resistance efflux pump
MKLAASGSRVRAGEILVQFDPQDQVRTAQDRRAEYLDFEEQIRKKRAEQLAARAHDQTELEQASNDVERAKLDVTKNDLLPKIEAEKNSLALEQSHAKLAALRKNFDLKRRAAEAEVRILEIRRDRARRAMTHAGNNARRMTMVAPFDGLAVVKQVWKGGSMGDVQEGEEVRPGLPIMDVVDPSRMQVRARINQADIGLVRIGQKARVQLDAYPDLVFDGRIEQLSPLALLSTLTPKVRSFVAIISISGSHPNLMPDLSAAVDVDAEGGR